MKATKEELWEALESVFQYMRRSATDMQFACDVHDGPTDYPRLIRERIDREWKFTPPCFIGRRRTPDKEVADGSVHMDT